MDIAPVMIFSSDCGPDYTATLERLITVSDSRPFTEALLYDPLA